MGKRYSPTLLLSPFILPYQIDPKNVNQFRFKRQDFLALRWSEPLSKKAPRLEESKVEYRELRFHQPEHPFVVSRYDGGDLSACVFCKMLEGGDEHIVEQLSQVRAGSGACDLADP